MFPVLRKYLSFMTMITGRQWPCSCHYSFGLILATLGRGLRDYAEEEPLPLLAERKRVGSSGIEVVDTDNGAVASLTGRIDIESSPAVREQLIGTLHAPHPRTVCIDLSGVTHIDSSGVATLLEALRIARNCKTELRLQGLHDHLHRLFEATGILSLFNKGIER